MAYQKWDAIKLDRFFRTDVIPHIGQRDERRTFWRQGVGRQMAFDEVGGAARLKFDEAESGANQVQWGLGVGAFNR
jgi:hypothetical protein